MIGRFSLLLSLFLLGFVAWMLSGSPVPMVFSFAFALSAFLARRMRRPSSEGIILPIAFAFLAVLAMIAQMWLFRTGLAFAFRADLPFAFHLGMAVLWFATSWSTFSDEKTEEESIRNAAFLAITGFVIVYAAAWATELYDFDEWQVFPLTALPLTLVLLALLRPSRSAVGVGLAVVSLCGIIAGLGWTVDRSTFAISKVFREKESQLTESASSTRPPPIGENDSDIAGARRLPRRTDIRFDNRMHIVIQTESPALFRSWRESPLYLRTSTVAIFESDELIAPIRSGRWLYDTDDENEDHNVTISLNASESSNYTVFCGREAASAIPLLPRSQTVAVESLYQYADDWYQLTPPEEVAGIRYEASAEISRLSNSDLNQNHNSEFSIPTLYLNLPPSPLAGKVQELCRDFSPSDARKQIRNYFERNTEYTLSYETPKNESPLSNLLFGEQQGHCELYAASAVLLLRASGIPSRIAYGYAGGLVDRERQMVAFRDRDYHAWAEILTPENEWVVFDVTPQDPNAAPRTPGATSLANFETTGYTDLSEGAPATARGRRSYQNNLALLIAFISDHFISVTIGFLVLTALIVGWNRRNRADSAFAEKEAREHSPSRVLGDLLRVLEDCGKELGMKKDRGMTWREWLAQYPDVPACFSDTVGYYYEVCYTPEPQAPQFESELRQSLRDWKESRVEH